MIRLVPTSLAAFALFAGCSAVRPCDHRDLQDQYGMKCVLVGYRAPAKDPEPGCLVGTVTADSSRAPIVVFAYRNGGDGVRVIESSVLPHSGQYSFAVPPGAYRLAAFEDRDRDLRYDPARERAVQYHDGRTIAVMPGQRVDRLYLTLRPDRSQPLQFEVSLAESRRPARGETPPPQCSTAPART
jgi:hypothetical protein